jgi:hypothetical protein
VVGLALSRKGNLTAGSMMAVSKVVEKTRQLGMLMHTSNLSTREAELGGSGVQGQPALHSEILSQKG